MRKTPCLRCLRRVRMKSPLRYPSFKHISPKPASYAAPFLRSSLFRAHSSVRYRERQRGCRYATESDSVVVGTLPRAKKSVSVCYRERRGESGWLHRLEKQCSRHLKRQSCWCETLLSVPPIGGQGDDGPLWGVGQSPIRARLSHGWPCV